jgi:2-methylcitrate dehydratase
MIINRVIDNAAVAAASLTRGPVTAARAQALDHPVSRGGGDRVRRAERVRTSPEWAAWANGVAVRELDYHDTFLAAEYSHPGDNIPPILAVAQHVGADGAALVRAIATGYEIQMDLVRAISLHKHKIDHVAHLGRRPPPASAPCSDSTPRRSTRPSRRRCTRRPPPGSPARARSPRGRRTPRLRRQDGGRSRRPGDARADLAVADLRRRGRRDRMDARRPDAAYDVPLPAPGEPKRAILDSYTKEHSAEYQAQAWIDLARKLHNEHPELADPANVESIVLHTSHHTHYVIGSGANDPQKYDPQASRETLDHSIPYIFAVALQDGGWHHVDSYAPERAARGHRRAVAQDHDGGGPEWTRRYHSEDPDEKAFGGRVEIRLTTARRSSTRSRSPTRIRSGAPVRREDYVRKFRLLAEPVLEPAEIERFLDLASACPSSPPRRSGAHRRPRRRAGRAAARRGCSDAVQPDPGRREAARPARAARRGRAAAFPGAFNPLSRPAHRAKGFEGVYISGAVLSPIWACPTSA